MQHHKQKVALTIAGLDPSGGAGIIADIKTFLAFGFTPAAAITSLTFQNHRAMYGAAHQTALTVSEQVNAIVAASRLSCVKTGMLPTQEIVIAVARLFSETTLPAPVVDPVLKSTSGGELMEPDAIPILLGELMPLARIITPNIPEAERLTGLRITNEGGMREAAVKLRQMGARAVLIKGGHLPPRAEASCLPLDSSRDADKMPALPREAIDVLDDDGRVTIFRGEWIDAPKVRGTGCMLSAAIAASLGQDKPLEQAVGAAKQFVSDSIRKAPR